MKKSKLYEDIFKGFNTENKNAFKSELFPRNNEVQDNNGVQENIITYELRKIEKRLYKSLMKTRLFKVNRKLKEAENDFWQYCEKNMPEIINENGISRKNIEELYHDLLREGAGQWIAGHWVAASALAYPNTLRFVFECKKIGNMTQAAIKLIMYFERGESLK